MDDLECEICCEMYNSENRRPRVLPCGHTFCSMCIAKEIGNGKRLCATCRSPHKGNSVTDLILNVTVERLIRNMPKSLSVSVESNNSDDGTEDDFNGGPCLTHKKGDLYFYCETHSVKICRECTVLNHVIGKCKIISFQEQIEKRNEDEIRKASLTSIATKETLSVLDEFVQEKSIIISKHEHKIHLCEKKMEEIKKEIVDERHNIIKEKNARENALREISQGSMRLKNLEAAKRNLKNSKTKNTMDLGRKSVSSESMESTKWMHDLSSEFKYTKVLGHLRTKPQKQIFLQLSLNGIDQGKICIDLDYAKHELVKGIPGLVTAKGEEGRYLLGKTCVKSWSDNLTLPLNRRIDGLPLIPPALKSITGFHGEVWCRCQGNTITALKIQVEARNSFPSAYWTAIGRVVDGQSVADACAGLRREEKCKITVSDCGIVFEA